MRGRMWLVASAGLWFAGAATAGEPLARYGGTYQNVRYIEEAGDLLGYAVDFRPGPKPVIVFTICEGECRGGKIWPVRVKGYSFTFEVCEDVVDRDDRPLPCEPSRYTGEFRRDGSLKLTPGLFGDRDILHRHVGGPKHWVEIEGCGKPRC